MKWRMTTMVVLSFALHGWLLWAAPVRGVQAPSGVVALKLGQVKLASAAPTLPPAPKQSHSVAPPAEQFEKLQPEPVQKKTAEKKPAEKKPIEKKLVEAKPSLETAPETPKPTPVQEAAAAPDRSQQSSAPKPAEQQSVSEEPVLVERPAFASPPDAPVYPDLARQRRQQGTVVVEVQLDHTGAQIVRRLLQSSGVDSLDEAALKAVAGWQFLPYLEDGQARLSRVQLPIRFTL